MRSRQWCAIGAVILSVLSVAAAAAPSAAGRRAPAAARRCALPRFGPGADYHPRIDPGRFSAHVTNPWFPLRVGTTYIYTGVDTGVPDVDVVVVTHRTRVLDGVRARVVADQLFQDGYLSERTLDYYAQDACGNVWYFGEDTAELNRHGHVTSREGTWHAGIDGAQPGVIMQAHPELGRRFRQEWYQGQAEDTFVARDLSTRVTVPAGNFRHALRTAEFSRLEPNVIDNKYYVQGIGEVKEVAVRGPQERLVLVEVIR